jgi:tubulin--tyrosine ligase like protein 10
MLSDCLALIQKDKELSVSSSSSPPSLAINEPTHLWIYKPSSSNRGRGVKVLQGGAELSELLQEYHPQLSGTGTGSGTGGSNTSGGQRSGMGMSGVPGRGIVQEYIMRPLLVEGFKFDLRVYMLIACVSPFVAYYHPGYCRRTLRQYSLDIATLSDPIIHLSNTSIQVR